MATANPIRENEQELRLALAMRGGSSMAVWIGGAVAEVNRLRMVMSDEPEHPWAKLATLAGYDSVAVDVLAGSSAGGLNATLLAASEVYGLPFDAMRSVWIRLADLESMARPVPKFWERDPESLLEGDDYFRTELARILRKLAPKGDSGHAPVGRAELLLTATLLDPVVEHRVDSRGGTVAQERRSASFRFVHSGSPGQPLSDFGTGDDFDATVLRLAHAARATSSFPFAFEPAQVHSNPDRTGNPDMFGFFSETSEHAEPFRVIDGGVLDNIPVTAAIRAIAAAPAARPTDRWLLYLNPEPTAARADRPWHRQLALPVVSVALQAKMAEESLLTDIEALDEHNRQVERMALRRTALFAEIASTEPAERPGILAARVRAVERDHARVRAELDAQAVCRLLTEPAGTEDGKSLPPVVGDPLEGWSAAARSQLSRRLSERMSERADADGLFADARALLSGVELVLSWARDIERWADETGLTEAGQCKATLYRLRRFGVVLEGHADRYWTNTAKLEPIVDAGELGDWVDRVLVRRARLLHELPSPVGPLVGAALGGVRSGSAFEQALSELAAELMSIVESSGADAVADNGRADADHVDAMSEATRVLHEVADRLAAAAPRRTSVEESEQLAFALLETADDRPSMLHNLIVLTAPLDIGREPGARINLLRVSGDQQSPLPFEALRRRKHGALWLEDKVRGGDLGNFASFLSARWRANDWMWGRVDAATSLIALLLDPQRLVRQNAERGAEGVCEALGEVMKTVSPGELGAAQIPRWQGFLAGLWSAHRDAVRAEIEALFARPDGEHSLEETKKALSERLHWLIVANELPYVAGVSAGADLEADPETEPLAPERLSEDVRGYAVGRQRLADLGERRVATVATRFALLGYRAALPSGKGLPNRLGRMAMTLVKPLIMTLVFALAAPRRAALTGLLAASATALLGAMTGEPLPVETTEPVSDRTNEHPVVLTQPAERTSLASLFDYSGTSYGVGTIPAMVLGVVFALWLCYQVLGRGRGLGRWLPAAIGAAVVVAAGTTLWITGFRLGVGGLILAAAVITWIASVAYRPLGRLAAALLSAAVFLGVWPLAPSPDAAMLLCIAVTGYAQMLLVGTVDVLRPRPRAAADDRPIGSSE